MKEITFIQPEGWAKPKGYANGVVTRGRTLHIAGQVGWNANCQFDHKDFVGQFGQALDNVLAVVSAAGGAASDVVSMTVFVTDLAAYKAAGKQLGAAWRDRFGRHYPAMALVGVAGLVEDGALLEIQAIAALPEVEA